MLQVHLEDRERKESPGLPVPPERKVILDLKEYRVSQDDRETLEMRVYRLVSFGLTCGTIITDLLCEHKSRLLSWST